MADFKNVYIYVSDALRYDHIPEKVAEKGTVIPTLTPAGYTPISFSSLATGLDPRNHSVRSFYDTLEKKTVFDLFHDSCYYDHPNDGMCRNVFANHTTSKELEDMEEPFFHIERALDTHEPYGAIKHGNKIPDESPDGTLKERYRKGVEATEKHFLQHVEKLKELGMYEDTLIIFTSDHGELLNEKKIFKERRGHNHPVCRELNIVPTVFYNHDMDAERMRTIDIAPTAASLTGREFKTDGIDLTTGEKPDRGYTVMDVMARPDIAVGCSWKWKEEWTPGISKIKTDAATAFKDLIEPLKSRLRGKEILNDLRRTEKTENGPVAHLDV